MDLTGIQSKVVDYDIGPITLTFPMSKADYSKLTTLEYEEIIWLLKSSESHEAIAERFGISIDTVQEIYDEEI